MSTRLTSGRKRHGLVSDKPGDHLKAGLTSEELGTLRRHSEDTDRLSSAMEIGGVWDSVLPPAVAVRIKTRFLHDNNFFRCSWSKNSKCSARFMAACAKDRKRAHFKTKPTKLFLKKKKRSRDRVNLTSYSSCSKGDKRYTLDKSLGSG